MAEAVENGASGSQDNGCPAPPTLKSSPNRSVPLLATPNKPPLEVDTRLPPGWRRKLSKRLLGSSAGTYDVYMFNPDGRRFRSCVEVEKYVAEKGLESELDCYVFDFSTFGTNNLTLRARREAQATPKKTVKKKSAVSKVAHKLIKQKAIGGKKKAAALKKKVVLKKAPVKTFAQKLVVKMDFLTRKRSANEDEESESESSDGEEEVAAAEATAGKKTVSNKKRKVDAKSSPAPKKTAVDKAASPRKTPKKGTGSSSSDDTPVVNGNAKGDDIENTQTVEGMDSAIHGGGDHNEQNNNHEPEQEVASPRKRASSKTWKDSSTPLKEVNNAADRHPNTPLSPSGRHGRSSSRDSFTAHTAQSPRGKSASEVSFHTPNKQKRGRLSKDSDRSGDEDALMESPGDLSHGQVDGAAADTPPRRGRGRPRKDASEPETPSKVGRGRPRKFPLNSPKQVVEAMETESPAKELTRSRRAVDKEQTGEGSAASGDNVSPTKRTRGRPKSQIQPVESDPESVNPQDNAEPVVKKKRGRPRKSLPGSVEDSNEVNLEQSELVEDSTEGNKGEIGEESPVKRGRGRPRKFPRTPGQAATKVSATGEKAVGSPLKTPAQIMQKRSLRESNKEEESVGESSTKKTPMVASKARVSDQPDDSITESPVRRSRGRPRKIPVVEFAEKRPRARPQREVVESREESNVIVTTAEIHREQSDDDDDELPTLTYEGEQDSPPRETTLHKEPPLLVLSSNITAFEDDSIEPDPELPVLVSMSPRKSARKPKPYFHKDFVSPTRKLISSYEQGRASSKKPKEDQTVKAVGTPKRGRPRKVSEPASEQEQPVKTPKRVAKLNEQTNDLERVASESENGIPISDQAARRNTAHGDTSDSSEGSVEEANECVNKVKKVVPPTGAKLGGSKLQRGDGVEEKVKGVQSVSVGVFEKSALCATETNVADFGGDVVKGNTTHMVEAMEGVSNVGVESVKEAVLPDAEEPPELMPVDSVTTVEESVPDTYVREMDPADRAVLCAMLLDHAYTNSLTYSLPPEIVEEQAPPVLEQTEAAAPEDVIEADCQADSVVGETETSNQQATVASTPFAEEPPKEQPKVATTIGPIAEEPKVVTTSVALAEEPRVATTIAPVVVKPKVVTASVALAEEPKLATAIAPVAEKPKVATTIAPVAEEPKVVTTSVALAEEPKIATPNVPVAEELNMTTPSMPVAEKTTTASADSPLFERFKSITPVAPVVEKPKPVVATSPMAKNLKAIVANSAVAGRLKAMTAITADKSKTVTATLAVAEKLKAVDAVVVEQSQIKEKTVAESKPLTTVKVPAERDATVSNKSAEDTLTKVKAGVKRKANAEALHTPVKHAKLQDKPIPGPSVGLVSKAPGVKSVKLKAKQGIVSEKISPAKLGISPGTLPRDMTTMAGLVKPMGIKGTVIVRKNPKIVPVKKGLTSPKNSETTSLAKLEKSLKGIKGQEKILRVTPKKISHKGGEKMSPIKSKKGKLNLNESERAALLKHKKGLKGEVQHKKVLHSSPAAEKAGHIKAKKHALYAKHGEMVPIGLHKKGAKFSKNISPDKHKKGHVGFKDGVKTSPEMIKKGLHRLKDGHKPTPDKLKKSIHSLKEGNKHKKVIVSHRDSDRTHTVKKSTHGLKDSERKTPDKPKKVTLSLKDSDKSPSEKPLKGILSVKESDKLSADKPLKGILTVKESEKTPSDKPLKGILSVKSSEKSGQLKPKKLSLIINTGEPESSAAKSSESEQTSTKPSTSDSTDNTDRTPDKSCLTSKNDQTETKSPNGTRRVSIGAVEINEIDQTKSPGPPSTSFDLASLAFAPPTPKLNKRRKSSDSKSPKVKKVGGTWSFTPLSKMPPVSPKTPTAETAASAGPGPKETASSPGTGPKSILKKS